MRVVVVFELDVPGDGLDQATRRAHKMAGLVPIEQVVRMTVAIDGVADGVVDVVSRGVA